MRSRAQIAAVALLLAVAGSLLAAQTSVGMRHSEQYEREMQDPTYEDPPDAEQSTEWAFARLRYRGPGQSIRSRWGTDSNKADRTFAAGVRRLTRVDAKSVEEVIDVDSDDVFNWPWLYAVENVVAVNVDEIGRAHV